MKVRRSGSGVSGHLGGCRCRVSRGSNGITRRRKTIDKSSHSPLTVVVWSVDARGTLEAKAKDSSKSQFYSQSQSRNCRAVERTGSGTRVSGPRRRVTSSKCSVKMADTGTEVPVACITTLYVQYALFQQCFLSHTCEAHRGQDPHAHIIVLAGSPSGSHNCMMVLMHPTDLEREGAAHLAR